MTDAADMSPLDLSPFAADASVSHETARQAADAALSTDALASVTSSSRNPASDQMRLRLMAFGGQLTLLMVGKQTTPEALASGLAVDPQLVLNLMCGSATDVSLRTLDHVANRLGGSFVFGWAPSRQAS